MNVSHRLKADLQIPLKRKVVTEGQFGCEWVPDGHRSAYVELAVDLPALLDLLGHRALRSKGGRSTAIGGLVRAKVIKSTMREERGPR